MAARGGGVLADDDGGICVGWENVLILQNGINNKRLSMKSPLFLRYIFISLLLSLSIPCFAQSSQEDWRSKVPVRRLHEEPSVIVVDSTDLSTYYLEPKEEKPKKLGFPLNFLKSSAVNYNKRKKKMQV